MALIPRALRPGMLVRRKALHSGILGASRFWKFMAVLVFGRNLLKKVFGRNPELLEKATLKGPGHMIRVETMAPDSRRARRAKASAGTVR